MVTTRGEETNGDGYRFKTVTMGLLMNDMRFNKGTPVAVLKRHALLFDNRINRLSKVVTKIVDRHHPAMTCEFTHASPPR